MRRPPGHQETGALTLSYVIVFPILLIALMSIAQVSLWYLGRDVALSAARQGADAARAYHAPAGAGPATALAFASTAGQGLLSGVSASAGGTTAATVQVQVTGNVPSFIPGLPIKVTETVQAPVERFAP